MSLADYGVFGDFASGPVEGIKFIRIVGPSHQVPASPRFLFGSVPPGLLELYYGQRGISSIGVFVAHGLELLGECMLRQHDTVFRCPELNIHPFQISQALGRLRGTAGRRKLARQYVVLLGPGHRVYGHWLIDFLPRLNLLRLAGYSVRDVRFLIPNDVPKWGLEWLALLGISPSHIELYDPYGEVIVADELLLPTILHNGNRVSPLLAECTQFLRTLIEINRGAVQSAGTPERAFISRRLSSQGRPLVNRERIEEIAVRQGFSVVHPQQLPLLDQVRLFAHAKQLVGEYGSALHGSIFSPPGTVVCALRGQAPHPGFVQSGIGTALGQPTGYVFGEPAPGQDEFGFSLQEEAFSACMRLVFDGVAVR